MLKGSSVGFVFWSAFLPELKEIFPCSAVSDFCCHVAVISQAGMNLGMHK